VGQGDAILVEAGDADIPVDGGPSGSAVLSYLAGQVVPDIDLVVATHLHADHIGGLDDGMVQYDVQEVWTNGATASTQTYQDFATAVAAEGAVERQIRRGYSTQFGGVTLTALDPTDPLTGDSNGDSIVLRLSCGSVDVLLTGDANADSEASMLADPSVVLDADLLKVGHHGSSTSTTDAFLDAVTPQEAVISVGAGNTYGHPAQETLNRLAAHGATVYRTDLNSTVVLTSDCSTCTIRPSVPLPQATPAPATAPPPPPPPPPPTSNCEPCYPDGCIPIGAADYDCGGGSGNGPNYIQGPVRVVRHPDPHGLDANGDGWGC
jgi:beta-lactamase superfamily II metal-dependent hydrolase